ncbi:MAG: iron-siderophore ABC transporter substrate-binding protein [Synechococcales bacterium]|nr:iron-siderophore ABC transporter substrate-binding protein [Synechococcales bacterium]
MIFQPMMVQWGRSIQVRYACIGFIIMVGLLTGCQQSPSNPSNLDPDKPTRTIDHAMGETQVPLAPHRVVVLDTTPLDATLALGIYPVGTIRYGAPPSYLGDIVNDIEVVGEYDRPNLETILKLKPDLILGAKSISAQLYPRLSSIAPTVFIEGAGHSWDWQNNFRIYAKALGEVEQAESLLSKYHQRVKALQSSLTVSAESIEVSVLLLSNYGLIAHTPKSFSGSVLEEIGFGRNPIQSNTNQFFIRLSREDLEGADGDIIFLIHNPVWETVSKSEFVSDPLWSNLNAVELEAICEVNADVWGSGRSILAAHQVLRDVDTCLTDIL